MATKEEEYFARENAEKLRKLALDRSRQMAEAQKAELKKLHWMRCPKCGMELQTITVQGLDIDRCFDCGATVFDAEEFEKLGIEENRTGTVMKSILNIFR